MRNDSNEIDQNIVNVGYINYDQNESVIDLN